MDLHDVFKNTGDDQYLFTPNWEEARETIYEIIRERKLSEN